MALMCWLGGLMMFSANAMAVPLDQRLNEGTIESDLAAFSEVQQRLRALNEKGVPAIAYHHAKAQFWLDLARIEYEENDRGNSSEQALARSLRLVRALELGLDPLWMDTPHIASSQRVRDDLWQQAEEWKRSANFVCAEPEIAELEVTLVHAGHEEWELGWRHARPEILAAERLARQIPELMANCQRRVPVSCACDIDSPDFELPRFVYFGLDKTLITGESRAKLERVAEVLKRRSGVKLRLEGYTDSLASAAYNQQLSSRRAAAVQRFLLQRGVSPMRMVTAGMGEAEGAGQNCTARDMALNRRVELVYLNASDITLTDEQIGLQVEPVPADCQ